MGSIHQLVRLVSVLQEAISLFLFAPHITPITAFYHQFTVLLDIKISSLPELQQDLGLNLANSVGARAVVSAALKDHILTYGTGTHHQAQAGPCELSFSFLLSELSFGIV